MEISCLAGSSNTVQPMCGLQADASGNVLTHLKQQAASVAAPLPARDGNDLLICRLTLYPRR